MEDKLEIANALGAMVRSKPADDLFSRGFLAGIVGTNEAFTFGPRLDAHLLEPVPLNSCALPAPSDLAHMTLTFTPNASKRPRLRKHVDLTELTAEARAREEVANMWFELAQKCDPECQVSAFLTGAPSVEAAKVTIKDVTAGKATSTLKIRATSLLSFVSWLEVKRAATTVLPPSEAEVYNYL
eukprot:407903-Amphidinium_carterae.1